MPSREVHVWPGMRVEGISLPLSHFLGTLHNLPLERPQRAGHQWETQGSAGDSLRVRGGARGGTLYISRRDLTRLNASTDGTKKGVPHTNFCLSN